MSTGLAFDPELSAQLDAQYRRPAMVLRRAKALELARPRLGEHVLDIGCGPGFLTADLGAGVGETGSVLGIDQSESMIALATRRCQDLPSTLIQPGDAIDLGGANGRFDLVVSTQVLEYVEAIDRALSEIARVLRPGGRAILLATDWRSVAWHSSDDARMDRMLLAWEEHLAHPALPRTLRKQLATAGLCVTSLERYSIVEDSNDLTGYSPMLVGAIGAFALGRQGITQDEVKAWTEDQRLLRESGAFHFSLGQYFFCVER